MINMFSIVVMFGLLHTTYGNTIVNVTSSTTAFTTSSTNSSFRRYNTSSLTIITYSTPSPTSQYLSTPSSLYKTISTAQSTSTAMVQPSTSRVQPSTSRVQSITLVAQPSTLVAPSPTTVKTSQESPISTNTPTTSGQPKTSVKNMKILWLHVKPETLRDMFYGSAGIALICIILLIIVCCCCRRQKRTLMKLQRENNTTLTNPYHLGQNVVGFPSPLQLDTFKPESAYDTPETVPEVNYVTVVDDNESEPAYAAVACKVNGTTNSIADSEPHDVDLQMTPDYTNASVFQIDPYQELMPNFRNEEDHYTSLIKTDINVEGDKSENEATV